jgi:hypothetical protein
MSPRALTGNIFEPRDLHHSTGVIGLLKGTVDLIDTTIMLHCKKPILHAPKEPQGSSPLRLCCISEHCQCRGSPWPNVSSSTGPLPAAAGASDICSCEGIGTPSAKSSLIYSSRFLSSSGFAILRMISKYERVIPCVHRLEVVLLEPKHSQQLTGWHLHTPTILCWQYTQLSHDGLESLIMIINVLERGLRLEDLR